MTLQQLRDLCRSVGFPDPNTMAAIAMAESGGNPLATHIVTPAQAAAYNASHPTGPRHGPERSFGLWQINVLAFPVYDETQLLDPLYNARAALAVSKGGTNYAPWPTFVDGSYLKYMGAP